MKNEPSGRLARWSRRKTEARGEQQTATGPAAGAPLDGVQRSAAEAGQVGAVSTPAPQKRGCMITDPIVAAPTAAALPDESDNADCTGAGVAVSEGMPPAGDAHLEQSAQTMSVVEQGGSEVVEPGGDKDGDAVSNTIDNQDDGFSDVDFDALDANSDYTRFMSKDVPEHIREKALAKLWTSNPVFNVMDGLDDYAEDFTDAVWAVADIRTDYKVGRGFLDDEDVAKWDALGADSKQRAQQEAHKKQAAEAEAAKASETGGVNNGLSVQIETPDQREILVFFAASERYHSALYPVDSNHFTPVSALMTPQVSFVVARAEGEIVGCGALVLDDEAGPENRPESRQKNGHEKCQEKRGEIKRMWVDPAGRGKGVGRAIVAELERLAAAKQVTLLCLETGNKQPEALGLYRDLGFQDCDAFGSYRADPLSIFMQKKVTPVGE